jgi:LacI family transcriptional regulator, galactose operon repressor
LTTESATSATMRTGRVGVLLPIVYDVYFSAILAGVAEAAYERGLQLVLSPTQHEHAREASGLDRLMRGATDGALIILPEESGAELELALTDGYPLVVIDPRAPLGDRIPAVAAAHEAGAAQAMEHLLALGHRRIAAITGPPGWMATEARLRAYHAALARARIEPEPEWQVASDFELGPGAAAAAAVLDRPEPPTAIFAFNDVIAIGAMHAAIERGMRVPEDLSIVGFDDITYATVVRPALTTVRQPLGEMGRAGVGHMLRLLEGEPVRPLQIELATRLVVRDSTAPPRRPPGAD